MKRVLAVKYPKASTMDDYMNQLYVLQSQLSTELRMTDNESDRNHINEAMSYLDKAYWALRKADRPID